MSGEASKDPIQEKILGLWKNFDQKAYDNPLDRAQAFQSVLRDSLSDETLQEVPEIGELGLDEVTAMISRLPDTSDVKMNLEELEALKDPKKLDRKIEDAVPQVRQDPKMLKALNKKGMTPEQFEQITRDSKFQAGLSGMAQQIGPRKPHANPPCHLCGQKSRMAQTHQGLPFCSAKCRKKFLRK